MYASTSIEKSAAVRPHFPQTTDDENNNDMLIALLVKVGPRFGAALQIFSPLNQTGLGEGIEPPTCEFNEPQLYH